MSRKRLKRCNCTHTWGKDCTDYDHEDTFYKLQMLNDTFMCPQCGYYLWEIVVRGGKHDRDQD